MIDNKQTLPSERKSTEKKPQTEPGCEQEIFWAGAILALYSIITLMLFRPILQRLAMVVIGPREDNMGDFWNTWYLAAALHPYGLFFTKLINYPIGTSLYYEDFAYPKVALIALLTHFMGHDQDTLVLLNNIMILISFPLAGLGAYLLTRRLSGSTIAGVISGYVFAFNPWHLEQSLHHMGVASIEFIPFFILFYLMAIERRSNVWLLAALAGYTLSALSCWYYLFYLAYFVIFHAAFIAWRKRAIPPGWHLYCVAVTLGGIIVILSPLLIPMVLESMARAGTAAFGHDTYVADAATWLIPAPSTLSAQTPLISNLARFAYSHVSGNQWEATNYLGLANIGLVVWLLYTTRHRSREIVLYCLCAFCVFAILASGARLHFLGHEFLLLPEAVFARLPLFSNVRTPARAVAIAYLFLGVMVGMAFELARTRFRGGWVWLPPVLLALLVLDFLPVGLIATPFSCSPGYSLLNREPAKDFGVLNLPSSSFYAETYMAEATCYQKPIVNVWISRNPSSLATQNINLTDVAVQREQLAADGVKYIILHRQADAFTWSKSDGTLLDYERAYVRVYSDPSIEIMRVY